MTDCPHPKSPRAKRCRSCNCKALWADPAYRAAQQERGRIIHREILSRPDVVAKRQAPALRKLVGSKRTATTLAAIPAHLRPEYRWLKRSHRMAAAQAREIILGQWKADIARRTSVQA